MAKNFQFPQKAGNFLISWWSVELGVGICHKRLFGVHLVRNILLTCSAGRILRIFSERISGDVAGTDGVSSVQSLGKPNVTRCTGLQQKENVSQQLTSALLNMIWRRWREPTGNLTFRAFKDFDFVRIEAQGRHAEEPVLVPPGIELKCSKLRRFLCHDV